MNQREPNCDCEQIECVCAEARQHEPDCKYRYALTCSVGIECEHGWDVCPKCDPCACKEETATT